jgi:hypothetical protein
MSLGPVDFIALAFPGNQFRGEILPDLLELVDRGMIRIFDLVIVMKDAQGELFVRELSELQGGELALIDPLRAEGGQMISTADVDIIAQKLPANTTAGLLLIENLWAKKTQQAMLQANGQLLVFERIPHDVVEEALAEVASLGQLAA